MIVTVTKGKEKGGRPAVDPVRLDRRNERGEKGREKGDDRDRAQGIESNSAMSSIENCGKGKRKKKRKVKRGSIPVKGKRGTYEVAGDGRKSKSSEHDACAVAIPQGGGKRGRGGEADREAGEGGEKGKRPRSPMIKKERLPRRGKGRKVACIVSSCAEKEKNRRIGKHKTFGRSILKSRRKKRETSSLSSSQKRGKKG